MVDPNTYTPAARILALKMTGQVGPRTFEILMAVFQEVSEILAAEESALQEITGIGPKRAAAIASARDHLESAQAIINNLEASDTKVVSRLDVGYPDLLHGLNDPPLLLFYKGILPENGEKRAAIIGSQEVTAEGIGDAVELAQRLTRKGVGIVGGLARGIDTAGHLGALKEKGKTYAVLPSGFNKVHPAENALLASQISESGALLSEYLPDTPVSSGRLMARNRLIIGLSHAVVIGEVSPDSVGTLDAALCCHQLGKLLFVIVGKTMNHFEELTGYGAIPITSIDDYDMIVDSLV